MCTSLPSCYDTPPAPRHGDHPRHSGSRREAPHTPLPAGQADQDGAPAVHQRADLAWARAARPASAHVLIATTLVVALTLGAPVPVSAQDYVLVTVDKLFAAPSGVAAKEIPVDLLGKPYRIVIPVVSIIRIRSANGLTWVDFRDGDATLSAEIVESIEQVCYAMLRCEDARR